MPEPTSRLARVGVVYLLTLAALLAAIATLSHLGHEVYEAVTDGGGVAALDHPAQDLALQSRSHALTTLMVALTLLGGRLGMPLLSALAILALLRLRRG